MPVFAVLSALGSLLSGSSSLYNAIKNSRREGNNLYLNSPVVKGLDLNGGALKKKRKMAKKNN